jgi:hypothetical protein
MREKGLTPIGPGFYIDDKRRIYFHVSEFLTHFGLPDTPEIRELVWAEVRRDFGEIGVTELSDATGPGAEPS